MPAQHDGRLLNNLINREKEATQALVSLFSLSRSPQTRRTRSTLSRSTRIDTDDCYVGTGSSSTR